MSETHSSYLETGGLDSKRELALLYITNARGKFNVIPQTRDIFVSARAGELGTESEPFSTYLLEFDQILKLGLLISACEGGSFFFTFRNTLVEVGGEIQLENNQIVTSGIVTIIDIPSGLASNKTSVLQLAHEYGEVLQLTVLS